jgi:MFS family permease
MLVFKDFLRRFGNPDPSAATGYSIPATRSSILVSLMSIGSLLGALSGAYTSDWWGRRKSLTFGVFLFIIGNVIQITSMESWIHMMMGRFVAGIGVGNLSVGELAHPCCFSMKGTRPLTLSSRCAHVPIRVLPSRDQRSRRRLLPTHDHNRHSGL